ncbi:insulinase family protein, partial [Vibrio sinaloensis]
FADNKEETLAEAISQLAALFKSEEAKGVFLPSQTDLVIAGNFKNRTAAELISDNLSDWKSSEAFSAPAELSLMPKSVSDAPKQEKPTVAYTAHTSLDDTANSKQQRKKLLTVTIANKILEKRLEEAFANQDVKVEVSNQILAQSSLVSQVSLTSEDSEQAKAAQQIIEKEINRARSSGFSQVEYEMVVSQLRKELEGQTRP